MFNLDDFRSSMILQCWGWTTLPVYQKGQRPSSPTRTTPHQYIWCMCHVIRAEKTQIYRVFLNDSKLTQIKVIFCQNMSNVNQNWKVIYQGIDHIKYDQILCLNKKQKIFFCASQNNIFQYFFKYKKKSFFKVFWSK